MAFYKFLSFFYGFFYGFFNFYLVFMNCSYWGVNITTELIEKGVGSHEYRPFFDPEKQRGLPI